MQRSQIRAARALLLWSPEHLAELSGVPVSAIKQLEPGDWSHHANPELMEKLQSVLEEGGVEFIPASQASGPGVRLKAHGAGSETVLGLSEDELCDLAYG